MGALIMTHSDDKGLVLPPKLAPFQVVIVPIYRNEDQLKEINKSVDSLKLLLEEKGVSVKYDSRDTHKPGWKFAEYELKGVPIRLALGMRDLENGTIEIARRDTLEKETVSIKGVENKIVMLLEEIQENLYSKAKSFRASNTFEANSYEEFKQIIKKGGFVYAHWDGTNATELKIKNETKATIRCIPQEPSEENGVCMISGDHSERRVLFAKAY